MNEFVFFIHALFIVSFSLGALKLGEGALIASTAIQALIANLFVLKQIHLFGFEVTASDAFAIGSLLSLNFLQEYFGREQAKKSIWVCFFFMFFFAIMSQFHLFYEPSPYDTTQSAFLTILSPSPRLLVASMSVFFIVQQLDLRVFAFLKKTIPNANFATRAGIALILSQFLDTFLFSFAGLYGIVASVFDVILISFLIKLLVIFCFTPLIRWARP